MKRHFSAIIMFYLLWVAVVSAADKVAITTVPTTAKCPVCGMFVAKYPDWTATSSFKDGSVSYYDGL